MSLRDAVAATYEENMHVIFNGDCYGAEWPIEAKKRGLPNLEDTPKALATFNSTKNKEVFSKVRRAMLFFCGAICVLFLTQSEFLLCVCVSHVRLISAHILLASSDGRVHR